MASSKPGANDLQVFVADQDRETIQQYSLLKGKFTATNYTYKLNGKPVEFKVIVNSDNKFEAQVIVDHDGKRVVEIIPLELADQLGPYKVSNPLFQRDNVPAVTEEYPSGPEIRKNQP